MAIEKPVMSADGGVANYHEVGHIALYPATLTALLQTFRSDSARKSGKADVNMQESPPTPEGEVRAADAPPVWTSRIDLTEAEFAACAPQRLALAAAIYDILLQREQFEGGKLVP